MNKIGLVTYYDNNYGSSLQCYATKKYLEEKGFKVVLINKKNNGTYRHLEQIYEYIKKIFYILIHPGLIKKILIARHANNKLRLSLSEESRSKIKLFVEKKLQPQEYSYSELKKMGKTDFFDYYICGSDQIWNFSSGFFSDFYTLKFVKKGIKIAFAPSIGTESIPSYIQKRMKKNLKSFNRLSVREANGIDLLSNMDIKNVTLLQDPTFLLDNADWKEFAKDGIQLKEKYILLHFLGEPSVETVKLILSVASEKKTKLVAFAYNYDVFKQISDLYLVEGSPYDYVSLISNAEYIFTDSFHSTIFSINLNKNFFVFDRNYNGTEKQTSRIKNILGLLNLENRFINPNVEVNYIDKFKEQDNSSCLNEERIKLKEFLNDIIINTNENKNNIKSAELCVGCDVCKQVCPVNAIEYIESGLACKLPEINKDSCKKCNLCHKICNKEIENDFNYIKKAYVGYNNSEKQRNTSASGGVFSALATAFLKKGGIVFGAQLSFENGIPNIRHVRIEKEDELYKIQNSKYARSACAEAYKEIKEIIKEDKKILFCGTPCQVDALLRYLSLFYDMEKINQKVYTVDLICHGTPSLKLFSEYINLINKKYNGNVIDFKFRRKENEKIYYEEDLLIESKGITKNIIIPSLKSSYYKMFLDGESYFEACYYCKYASDNRPANITLGDYFELAKDYPNIYDNIKDKSVNSIIVNNEVGEQFLREFGKNIEYKEVEYSKVQMSHKQLCKPAKKAFLRYKLQKLYNKKGYSAIDKYYKRDYMIKLLPRKAFAVIKKCYKR